MEGPSQWTRLGTVRSVNPARRSLRVRVRPAVAGQLAADGWCWLRGPGDEPVRKHRVVDVQDSAADMIVYLGPGTTRDSIARMKGAEAVVPAEAADGPAADDYEIGDLLDAEVVGPGDELFGTVTAVYDSAAHGIMEITKTGGGQVLLPVIDQTVQRVDVRAAKVWVRDIAPYVVEDED